MKKYILAACALWFAGQALAADFSGNWGYEQELEDGIYGKYFNIKIFTVIHYFRRVE